MSYASQAAQRLGAVAVPVDVDPQTYCIDPEAVAAAITPRTRAIMPVYMAGHMADMDALGKLSESSGVPILQDAAHAYGAQWLGKRVGELGSVAAFSFQNGKLMTAGEGGLVTVTDQEQYDLGFLRHSCGRPPTDRLYLHQTSGSNFRMNEFSASVLRAQLSRLDGQIADLLSRIPGVVPQARDERCDVNPHYMAMFRIPGIAEEDRNRLVDRVIERGLPAFAAFRAICRSNGFWESCAPDSTVDEIARQCPNTEEISRDCGWLHHRTLLAGEEQMHVIAEVLADVLATA